MRCRRLKLAGAVLLILACWSAMAVDPEDDEVAPSPLHEARVLLESGHYRQAISELQARTATAPDDADAWNLLGFGYRKLGDYDTARAHYDRALSLAPNHLGALEYLGELYFESGELAHARALLARLGRACGEVCHEYRELAELLAQGD